MLLRESQKLLIANRRLYEGDKSRYFLGAVECYENGIVKLTGNTWVKDAMGGSYYKKGMSRTKIYSIISGTLIVYEIPSHHDLNKIRIERTSDGVDVLTDGENIILDLSDGDGKKKAPQK